MKVFALNMPLPESASVLVDNIYINMKHNCVKGGYF